MMILRQLTKTIRQFLAPPQSRLASRTTLMLETLEDRTVPTIVFGTTPVLTINDGGGPVLPSAHVELVFWGNQWNTAANQQFATTIQNAVDGILAGPYVNGLAQYRNIGHPVRDGSVFVTNSSPGSNFVDSDVRTMLKTELEAHNIPNIGNVGNRLYFVITQPNSTDPAENLFGEHSQQSFVALKFLGIQITQKTAYAWAINDGTLDTVTNAFSHELAESLTDPDGTGFQINPRNANAWNEVSDGAMQNFSYRLNGVKVQSYWSAQDNAAIVSDGNMQKFKLVNGVLSVSGDQLGNNYNDVIVIDQTAAHGVKVTMNGETVQFDPGQVNTINVQTFGGANRVDVVANRGGVTLNIDGGFQSKDTVTLGKAVGLSGASLTNITGTVNVSNTSGQTTLVVDDSGDTFGRSATISSNAVTGLSLASIHYTPASFTSTGLLVGVNALKVRGSSHNNAFDILGTASNTPLDLNAGAGNDTVNVRGNSSTVNIEGLAGTDTVVLGYQGPSISGSMVNLTAPVNVSNASGTTSLVLSDSADTVGRTINLTDTQVTGMAGGTIGYTTTRNTKTGVVTGVTLLTLNGGLGGDRLNASPLPADTTVTYDGGLGNNTLAGPNAAAIWNITNTNTGTVNGLSFVNTQNLVGGFSDDVFKLANGKGITGNIDGGSGFDFLDYSAWTSPVLVNLATGVATGVPGGVFRIEGVLGGNAGDTLIGSSFANVLVGGGGNDHLSGGTGRSILIGGLGTDTLSAGTGDALMIGGQTQFDLNTAALTSLMNEWQRTDISYMQRVTDLRLGGGLNGLNRLALGVTVFDDGLANRLVGNTGADWFFRGSHDHLVGVIPGELIN